MDLQQSLIVAFLKNDNTTFFKKFVELSKFKNCKYMWNLIWYIYFRFIGMNNPFYFIWFHKKFQHEIAYIESHNIEYFASDEHLKKEIMYLMGVLVSYPKHVVDISYTEKISHVHTNHVIGYRIKKLVKNMNVIFDSTIRKQLIITIDTLDSENYNQLFVVIYSYLCKNKLSKSFLMLLFTYLKKYYSNSGKYQTLINYCQDLVLYFRKFKLNSVIPYVIYDLCVFLSLKEFNITKNKTSLNDIIVSSLPIFYSFMYEFVFI